MIFWLVFSFSVENRIQHCSLIHYVILKGKSVNTWGIFFLIKMFWNVRTVRNHLEILWWIYGTFQTVNILNTKREMLVSINNNCYTIIYSKAMHFYYKKETHFKSVIDIWFVNFKYINAIFFSIYSKIVKKGSYFSGVECKAFEYCSSLNYFFPLKSLVSWWYNSSIAVNEYLSKRFIQCKRCEQMILIFPMSDMKHPFIELH